ncbi:MAG: M1 family metallopeptidase [Maribacter sp.]
MDFTKIAATLEPNLQERSLNGQVTYTYVLNARIDSIFIDAKNMQVTEFKLDGRKKPFSNDGKKIGFEAPRKTGEHEVVLSYVAKPKQALYFVGFEDELEGNEQIWTQGQGKYTSNWLPSFDDMTEKIEVDLQFIVDANFEVIANGKLQSSQIKNGKKTWQFDMQNPISSYLIAFAIGNYEKQSVVAKNGTPLENYYYPTDANRVEPTYRYTKEIFDFLETEIGVSFPWQNYKQIPVHDFLYAGMENTGTTLFSDSFVIDSVAFIDENYVNVNAHEMAHQWFGDLVTEQSGEHHWLQEGFATYYAYLAGKHIFGDDHFYWNLLETAKVLKERSDRGEGQRLLDPKADSTTFYEKGAWALVILREKLGDDAFKKGIISYLNTYKFQNVTVDDFLAEMEKASGENLKQFRNTWLDTTIFSWDEAFGYLKKNSKSIQRYENIKAVSLGMEAYFKDSLITSFWTDDTSVHIKKQFIFDFKDRISDAKLLEILKNESVEPRQALAVSRDKIYTNLKPLFESMLEDKSYVTVEMALYKLWSEFENDRVQYLNVTKNVIGLPNKNVRTLWLGLAIITPTYNLVKKKEYIRELQDYTSSKYNSEVRQNAFQYLSEIKLLNGVAMENLIKATDHHSWQFRIFARRLLDQQLTDEEQKKEIESVAKNLSNEELKYLKTKIQLP